MPLESFRGEKQRSISRGSCTLPYFEEHTRHPPHHSAEESSTDDIDPNLRSYSANLYASEFTYGIFNRLVKFLGVSPKVMFSHEMGGTYLHSCKIERLPMLVRKTRAKGVRRSRIQSIPVEPVPCTKSAMEGI